MKRNQGRLSSRRAFLQLATAATGSIVFPLEGHASDTSSQPAPDLASAYMKQVHQSLSLNSSWTVTPLSLDTEGETGYKRFMQGGGEPIAALVPGEIHLDLMRIGRMEDPNISDNARTRCRWPEEHSWWYRTEFTLPTNFRQQVQQLLIFDGIDLYGQVFLNGKLAGTTRDAFVPIEIDVKHFLQDGTNELVVRLTSGMELPSRLTGPQPEGMEEFISKIDPIFSPRLQAQRLYGSERKPECAYGQDYCEAFPNIGIWRGVRIEGRSQVIFHHLRLDTVIRGQEVSLEGEVTLENLHPWSEIPCLLELQLETPHGRSIVQRYDLGTPVGRSQFRCRMVVPDPQLWWPNGMGEQPLYRLIARVLCSGQETDLRVQTIGLRTIELDRSPLPEGSRFCFKVNGHKLFCKGGNWVQTDMIAARTDTARYEKLVAEARNAHFTMFRVNGDSLYESDDFYDACDRAGILVWQEFMISDNVRYPDHDPEYLALVRNEAEAVVKRLRHHPSIALWCGNNECQMIMRDLSHFDPKKPDDIGGVKFYNEVFPDICQFYDPVRPYWPGSPSGGVDPNREIAGDYHGLGGFGPADEAQQEKWREILDANRARFVSESYVIGPPHMASVREYLKPDELSLDSFAWRLHTNELDNGATAAGIRYHYGDPKGLSLPQFVLYGQMYQSIMLGNFLEALRFRKDDPKDDCEGHLFWCYDDVWGEMGWSIVDHYLRRKAAYYWFRRGAAPVKILVRSRRGHLVTRVVNDTLKKYQALAVCGWLRLDGKVNDLQERPITIPANGTIEVVSEVLPSNSGRDPREWLYAATLTGPEFPDDQAIWPLMPHRELKLPMPAISTAVQNGIVKVSSPVYCHGVHLEDEGQAVLADNYFDLLPGIPRQIPILVPSQSAIYPLTAIMPISSR
jgi:beta-mannosidase